MNRLSLLWPTVATLCALAVLLSLGTWQLQRRSWKDTLIRQVEARAVTAPGPLPARAHWGVMARPEVEFTRITAEGRFDMSKAVLYYRVLPAGKEGTAQGQGWDVVAPLMLADGSALLVNRGFIPKAMTLAEVPPVADPAQVTGVVRLSEPRGLFAASDDGARKRFYTRDIAAFAAAMGLGDKAAPFMLDAEAGNDAAAWPRAGAAKPSLPNKHFEYALTWYGLALTLVGVYAAFVLDRRRRRDDLAQTPPMV